MGQERISRLSLQLFVLDLLLTPVGLGLATVLRAALPFGPGGNLEPRDVQLPWFVYVTAVICWSVALVLNGAYLPQLVLRWYNEAARVLTASILACGLLAGVVYFTFRNMSRLQMVYFLLVNVALLLGHRAALRIYYRLIGRARPGWRSRILVVGAGDLGQRVAKVLQDHSRWGFSLVGYLDDDVAKQGQEVEQVPVLGTLDDLRGVVEARSVGEVWVALPPRAYERVSQLVTQLEPLPVRVKIVPDYFSLAMIRAKPEILGGIPLVGLREPVIEGVPRLIKRGFDLVVSSLTLLAAAPVMALIALAIRLDSPGPVLFRQRRVGENGRLFDMLKFRTMVVDADAKNAQVLTHSPEGKVIHKQRRDPRVTRVGSIVRRFSLDELPQLMNVLKGQMSLVGPRPEMPWLVEMYKPWQRKRFAVPQGMTGWWQINGRSDKPMHLNTEDDLYYVYNYSLWLDIVILLRTPIAVLQGKGAF